MSATRGVTHERLLIAEQRIKQLEAENALLKRALAMLTRSLEETEVPQ